MQGIDVSYAQGSTINWATVAANRQFAFIRASYGNDITSQDDTQFAHNMRSGSGALDSEANDGSHNKLYVGFYHYAYYGGATSEADHFMRVVEPFYTAANLATHRMLDPVL